ncbi:hypothetical protein NBRC116188_27440 [Oceaniserpentilla sp. 4NH20-0058]|uniref:hypothetical protein n=1 Tax=Oceaniserpentilla sp. 4NH20-0058 TaxID=3127660 RepID=UPI00310C787C
MKGLPLTLAFLALPAFSAPQLSSEIQAGDVWLTAGVSQSDADWDLKNPDTGVTFSDKQSSDEFIVSSLFALDNNSDFTPVIGFSFKNEKEDDDTSKIFSGKLGALKKTSSGKNIGLFVEYNHSDNPDATRGSYGAELILQTSDKLSKINNQLELSMDIPKAEGINKGGRTLAVINTLKISSSDEVDLELFAGIGVISDINSKTVDTKAKSDPFFGLGGKVYFNLDKSLTVAAGISKAFAGATYSDSFGNKVNADLDDTSFGFQLISRF